MHITDILELEPITFCYWLQGSIEIGDLTTFDEDQADTIRRTLLKLKYHNDFTLYIHHLVRSMPPDEAFHEINAALQSAFLHEIDNSYAGDQQFLHLVHIGKKKVLPE